MGWKIRKGKGIVVSDKTFIGFALSLAIAFIISGYKFRKIVMSYDPEARYE